MDRASVVGIVSGFILLIWGMMNGGNLNDLLGFLLGVDHYWRYPYATLIVSSEHFP